MELTKERKTKRIVAIADQIIIKQDVTFDGIVLPKQGKEQPVIGTVIATGQGKLTANAATVCRRRNNEDSRSYDYFDMLGTEPRIPMEVQVGNTVVYFKYAGITVEIEGESYLVMRESDLLVVLE